MLAYGSCQRYKGGGDIREAYCIYAWLKNINVKESFWIKRSIEMDKELICTDEYENDFCIVIIYNLLVYVRRVQ